MSEKRKYDSTVAEQPIESLIEDMRAAARLAAYTGEDDSTQFHTHLQQLLLRAADKLEQSVTVPHWRSYQDALMRVQQLEGAETKASEFISAMQVLVEQWERRSVELALNAVDKRSGGEYLGHLDCLRDIRALFVAIAPDAAKNRSPAFCEGGICVCGADVKHAPGIGSYCSRTGIDAPCVSPKETTVRTEQKEEESDARVDSQ
jgi:hypothetical protein